MWRNAIAPELKTFEGDRRHKTSLFLLVEVIRRASEKQSSDVMIRVME
jgi:hypothetical protein